MDGQRGSARGVPKIEHNLCLTCPTKSHIRRKTYWVVTDQGNAALIDPETLNSDFVNQLTNDLDQAKLAFDKNDQTFTILKNCPALTDLILRFVDRATVDGMSGVTLEPMVTIKLKNESNQELELTIKAPFQPEPPKIQLTAFEIGNRPKNPNATPLLPFKYTISYIRITQTTDRQTLEEKLLKRYYQLRSEMDTRYRAASTSLAARLALPSELPSNVGEWSGKPVAQLSTAEQSLLKTMFQSNGAEFSEWSNASIESVKSQITLRFSIFLRDGSTQPTTYVLPTGLF